ncbi:circadian clock-controlled protein [Clostridium sporogenes]|uniref:circadian clock-controlled protein n=1 Tax=Clostridium sporogenes TaxID=1509 RepID=UPI0013D08FF7|nr:circadian clock-controlled protein [Clostridium sporogenes]NFQ84198.1 circadian clock-controlled protein [Clostridium sporogenes]
MAKKISISFKETDKDTQLYDFLLDMEDRSCEVKKVLREAFKIDNKTVKKDNTKKEKEEINILNF